MNAKESVASMIGGLVVATVLAAQPVEILPGSVNDIMVSVITPVTNTIWGIEDPQTDEEWQVYIDAAQQLVDAASRIKSGGAGPNDASWASESEWQRYANILIESGQLIGTAAENKDLEQLIEVSNDVMYPPCEECHLIFHPGLQEQEFN